MNRKGWGILKKNIFETFLEKLLDFPLWVKQVIYLRLHQNLYVQLSDDFIKTKEEDIFHLYSPNLSFIGRTELFERKCGLDENVYNFLAGIAEGLNMLEISMNNFWTMEEVAKYYIFCLEQNYVKTPESTYIHAMAGFMAGKFRTGEYFKRTGKINVDQLEKIIITQKEYQEKGTPMKMAEVMISLGYITEKDPSSLLMLKEESKRRFILDPTLIPKQIIDDPKDLRYYKDQVVKLSEQNKLLKEQLNKILAFIKKK